MNTTTPLNELMKKEAARRLKILRIESTAVKDFKKNGTFWVSENFIQPGIGRIPINYFTTPGYTYEEEVKKAIAKVKELGGLPYWGIVNHTRDGGLWISVLYVSKHPEEWNMETPDTDGTIFSAVYSTDMDILDLGNIGIRSVWGGLIRTA